MNNKVPFFRFFLKLYWYLTRLLLFFYISLKVLWHGIFHPRSMYNFFFGVVTEIAEFHKKCRENPINFSESRLYKKILSEITLPKNNCFNTDFGTVRPGEAQVLSTLVSVLKPKMIFEFGTYFGLSTLHLLKNAPEDATIHTIDLPKDSNSSEFKHDLIEAHKDMKNIERKRALAYQSDKDKNRIIEHFCDSTTFDYSKFYKKMDFIFIDANHSYSFVKSDTENAFKMLTANGVILWHDYDFIHPGIFKYINELSKEKKIYYIERTRFAIYINNDQEP